MTTRRDRGSRPQTSDIRHQTSGIRRLAAGYWLLATLVFVFLLAVSGAYSLPELPEDRGIAGLLQALERLPVVASAMHTTAHPDDEDNGLLVYLSHGVHARTILLSATRGDGGQSLIGPEKFEAMGIVRTGELLAANQYYGAELHFTRAYEFGYSKTAEETLAKWGHEEILADFVRVIRMTRPDIIVSRFSGTPRDRHGHHQAAGILTREAFRAAADPNRFPEQIAAGLRPWQAKKLYLDNRRFGPSTDEVWNVKIDLGARDPILGRSYHEIGMEGLSKQRSQGVAGIIPRRGSLDATFTLLDSVIPTQPKETGLFDGIDTTIAGIATRAGSEVAKVPGITTALGEIQQHITAALAAFNPHRPEATVPHVLAGLAALRKLIASVQASDLSDAAKDDLLFVLRGKERDFVEAAHRALAIEVDARADDETVIPGQAFKVTVSVYNRGREAIEPTELNLSVPAGWQVVQTKGHRSKMTPPRPEGRGLQVPESPGHALSARGADFRPMKPLAGGENTTIEFVVKVADNAEFTQPYWYRPSEEANRYEVRSEKYYTLPYAPPEVIARLDYKAFGQNLELSEPARAAHINPAVGVEFRTPQVVPAISVQLQPRIAIAPRSTTSQERQWQVTILNNTPAPVGGTVELQAPAGWTVAPRQATYRCSRKSEEATIMFRITIPGGTDVEKAQIKAIATLNGRGYTAGYQVISTPNVWTCHLYHPAVSEVKVFDVQVAPNLTVGYILGPQDEVPEALRQLGVKVQLLGPDDLAFGDLSQFDCIIAGARAYVTRDDLKANNQRLLKYVEDGGVYIVQYNNESAWNRAPYAPYPARMTGNERITVEDSPVEILEPEHPIFNMPNRITADDFRGWVQERGLYFWSEWDPRYKPLLSGRDPGEPLARGGLLEAQYGKGIYIYTGYAWFRQLPAGVPGAYRLFANLVSLPKMRTKT